MGRDLSKGLKAQKHTESKSKFRFGEVKKDLKKKEQDFVSRAMLKLTATITQDNWHYLQGEVLRRSQKRGKMQNTSQVLREILQEHQSTKGKR